MRIIIFANGDLNDLDQVQHFLRSDDFVIAADGGAKHCQALGLVPDVIIGDFDSLEAPALDALKQSGAQVFQHPRRKDYTDLELAIRHAITLQPEETLILGALGARWDQTLANLLLPAAFPDQSVRLVDGQQEIILVIGPGTRQLNGNPGDTVSLIPVQGHAHGIATLGLEYALHGETLFFGETRGISNVLINDTASIGLESGMLICVHIRLDSNPNSS
jgi:thiamine pyrophosphokinase